MATRREWTGLAVLALACLLYLLLERYWWGSVFLLALPVMALLLVLGPRVLREFRDPNARRLELPSAAMSLSAVLAVIYGLKDIAQDGFGLLPALIIVGIALGALFVRRQSMLADPLIDIKLFRIPSFGVSLVTYMMGVLADVPAARRGRRRRCGRAPPLPARRASRHHACDARRPRRLAGVND